MIEGSVLAYSKLLSDPIIKNDVLYLLALHSAKSKKFKKSLNNSEKNKITHIVEDILKVNAQDDHTRIFMSSVIFAVINKERYLLDIGK